MSLLFAYAAHWDRPECGGGVYISVFLRYWICRDATMVIIIVSDEINDNKLFACSAAITEYSKIQQNNHTQIT